MRVLHNHELKETPSFEALEGLLRITPRHLEVQVRGNPSNRQDQALDLAILCF